MIHDTLEEEQKRNQPKYIIRDEIVASCFWNNNDGFGSIESATIFSENEKEKFNLPMDGEWIKLPN